MSWHYLQELEEASWAGISLDGAPSALLSLLPTPAASYLPGSGTGCCRHSLCGMTCEPSTGSLGADTSMSLPEASPARTSALPEKATALTESEADCGPKWPGSLARYNPGSRSWRTAQCSLLGGLTEFSATFPRWGMMRSGELWERTTPVLRIEGKGSGYWPTPTTFDSTNRGARGAYAGSNHHMASLDWIVRRPEYHPAANTPSGNWPTPKACDGIVRHSQKWMEKKWNEGGDVDLTIAVKMWPTPQASDNRDRGNMSDPAIQRRMEIGKQVGLSMAVKEEAGGGSLNPDWVEWLMNWPIGWTSMEPLNPDRFRAWLQAFPNVPTASKPSETDKCQRP
jgi:hypothetical protein